MMTKFCVMELRLYFVAALALVVSGCGVAYQASTEVRAARMQRDLKVGESAVAVHQQWGEPDLRKDADQSTEILELRQALQHQ